MKNCDSRACMHALDGHELHLLCGGPRALLLGCPALGEQDGRLRLLPLLIAEQPPLPRRIRGRRQHRARRCLLLLRSLRCALQPPQLRACEQRDVITITSAAASSHCMTSLET